MSEPDDISPEEHAYWEGRAESEQEISRLRAELEQERSDRFDLGVRRVAVCLGCGKHLSADCGCPAGTAERLVNMRAEAAEARVRELEQSSIYLILYEEDGRGYEVFMGKGAEEGALKCFEQASLNWNCRLFRQIKQSFPSEPLYGDEKEN